MNLEKLAYLKKVIKYKLSHKRDLELAYQHGDPLKLSFAYFKRSFLRRLRLNSVRKVYELPKKDEDFILYPLHFHPEASTSIQARDYVDEINVIKAIAFRLPSDLKLYVKEHPSAVAIQKFSFYKELQSIPNVRLISPSCPGKQLIRDSKGVITLTSTMGFEAAVLNRPVIVLGLVFYSYFPNVKVCKEYSQLTELIDWALNFENYNFNEIKDALTAYIEFTSPGSFDFRNSLNNAEALRTVASLIDSKISTHITDD